MGDGKDDFEGIIVYEPSGKSHDGVSAAEAWPPEAMWYLQTWFLFLEIAFVISAYRSIRDEEARHRLGDLARPSTFKRSVASARTLDRQRQIWYLQTSY
jgi:hypothetical protein